GRPLKSRQRLYAARGRDCVAMYGRRCLSPSRCRLHVACVVGGDAIETIGMAVLAGEGSRSLGGVGQERRKGATVVGNKDAVRRAAGAARALAARLAKCEPQ